MDWSKFLDLLKQPVPVLLVIGITGLTVLFAPEALAACVGFDAIRDHYRPVVGVITFLTSGVALTGLGKIAWDRIQQNRRKAAEFRALLDNLAAMNIEERIYLGYCVTRRTTTLHLPLTDPVGASLRQKRLLVQASGVGNRLAWAHVVPSRVYETITAHPNLVMSEDDFQSAEPEMARLDHIRTRETHWPL